MALRRERRLVLQKDNSKACAKDNLTVAWSVERTVILLVIKKEKILDELSAVAMVVEWVRELVDEMVGQKVYKTDAATVQ